MMVLIQADNLTIGYIHRRNDVRHVAANLSVSVHPGELICLVGPNGSGKSTLLKTLTGIIQPLAGDVLVSGKKNGLLSSIERAKLISVVLTNPVSAGQLTVYEVCCLGRYPYTNWTGELTRRDHDEVFSALETIGIVHFAGRSFHELSDGERQKVMIARALAQSSDLIVLDEPTAFLDLPYRLEIMHILMNLCQKQSRGIILSTHDLDLAMKTADRLWVMNRGGEFYSGAPEDMALNGIISKVFATGTISFDAQHGRFHIPGHQRGSSRVTGENGTYRFWTERALERIGLVPGNTDNPSVHVDIMSSHDDARWVISTPVQTQEFSTLTDGISWIQDQNVS